MNAEQPPASGSPKHPVQGLIAILDALGAATYSESEIERFLESRELVLNKLDKRAQTGTIRILRSRRQAAEARQKKRQRTNDSQWAENAPMGKKSRPVD